MAGDRSPLPAHLWSGNLRETRPVVGMQPVTAGRVLKASINEITEVDVEGHRAWALTEEVPAMTRAGGPLSVRLVGGFDVYTVGTRPALHCGWAIREAGIPTSGLDLTCGTDRRQGRGV